MLRGTIFLLFLTACSGVTFTGAEGGLGELKPDGGSSTDADSGSNPGDSGGLDRVDPPGDSSTDAKPTCPDSNDVEFGGRCYYFDGSRGACDQGYTLSTNAKLAAILAANASAWQGKSYKHVAADSVCILTKDNVMNFGMYPNTAPFVAGNPQAGADGCWMISPPQMYPKQITLCESQ